MAQMDGIFSVTLMTPNTLVIRRMVMCAMDTELYTQKMVLSLGVGYGKMTSSLTQLMNRNIAN